MKSILLIMVTVFLLPVTSSAASLSDPPVWNFWAYAEYAPVSESADDSLGCDEKVEILYSFSRQVATDSFSFSEREHYGKIAERFKTEFEDATRKERALLQLDLMQMPGTNQREITQAWIRIDGMIVHCVRVFDDVSGGLLYKVEDETTGAYIGLVDSPNDPDKVRGLIKELLAEGPEGENSKKILNSIEAIGSDRTMWIDVSGVVLFVDQDKTKLKNATDEGFEVMWQHLPDNDGKRRIEMAIPVLWAAMSDKEVFSDFSEIWFTNPKKTPVDYSLSRCGFVFQNGTKGGDMLSFEAPPDEILKDFFGKPELPLPSADWNFKKLTKKIL